MSEDALTNPQKLMVLIHGSGVVRAGQWARRLIINEDLDSGTQIPFIKRAMDVSALSFIFFGGSFYSSALLFIIYFKMFLLTYLLYMLLSLNYYLFVMKNCSALFCSYNKNKIS